MDPDIARRVTRLELLICALIDELRPSLVTGLPEAAAAEIRAEHEADRLRREEFGRLFPACAPPAPPTAHVPHEECGVVLGSGTWWCAHGLTHAECCAAYVAPEST